MGVRTKANSDVLTPNDDAGVMSAASWALMLCKPGMRPPTIEAPGTCVPTTSIPNDGMFAPCVGRLSGVRSPPRGISVVAVAGIKRIFAMFTVAFTGGRVISVEPLRKPFVTLAGISRSAAAAADALRADPGSSTAHAFAANAALTGGPRQSGL